jgi:hypothetical protein
MLIICSGNPGGIKMKSITEDSQRDMMERKDIQDKQDFFKERYIDFFPKDHVL